MQLPDNISKYSRKSRFLASLSKLLNNFFFFFWYVDLTVLYNIQSPEFYFSSSQIVDTHRSRDSVTRILFRGAEKNWLSKQKVIICWSGRLKLLYNVVATGVSFFRERFDVIGILVTWRERFSTFQLLLHLWQPLGIRVVIFFRQLKSNSRCYLFREKNHSRTGYY